MSIFKKIAKETGLSVKEIKEAVVDQDSDVGLIKLDIKNIEDAKETFIFFQKILHKHLEEWNKLSLEELEKASTIDQVTYVFENVPPESEAYIKTFNKLFLMINSVEDLTGFYYWFDTGSPEATIILQKIYKIYKDNS